MLNFLCVRKVPRPWSFLKSIMANWYSVSEYYLTQSLKISIDVLAHSPVDLTRPAIIRIARRNTNPGNESASERALQKMKKLEIIHVLNILNCQIQLQVTFARSSEGPLARAIQKQDRHGS